MRVFAVSDVHVDYEANAQWIANLSSYDYQHDLLILAGDVTDNAVLLDWCLRTLVAKFRKVLFVPGNHDLWVIREPELKTSLDKYQDILAIAECSGASMSTHEERDLRIVPLLGWYDYSFGEPSERLRSAWMDYRACRWPPGYAERDVAAHFTQLNPGSRAATQSKVITFSHFLPRIDVMPAGVSAEHKLLYPVLGLDHLDRQLRDLGSSLHVYGHSHVNRAIHLDGVWYVNNALGYPNETWHTGRELSCIYEC
jgi:predicted phosphodiesterase